MADRIVVMRDGDIVQLDTPEELFAKPQSAWVCQFVGSGNLLRGNFKSSTQDEVELSLGGDSVLRAQGSLSENIALQIPFAKVRVEHGGDGGLKVTGKRFLGAALELQIETPAGLLCAHLEPKFGAEFEVGSTVKIAAEAHDCRVVPA